jgi:hypothetical protein
MSSSHARRTRDFASGYAPVTAEPLCSELHGIRRCISLLPGREARGVWGVEGAISARRWCSVRQGCARDLGRVAQYGVPLRERGEL